jgi:anthranilate 1,2-dioxygenase (deaminating, decarboxylating) large subunit
MKHSHYRVPAICLLFILLLATAASAYLQPSVNLGFTSFLDGAPPAGPGFYFQEYISYYEADDLPQLGVPGAEVEAWVSLNQFIYQSNTPLLLGGKWGMNVIVPVVLLDADPEPPLSTNDGLGDIVVGPFLQWDPIMGKNGPIFMHRVELQMLLPTGKYDKDDPLNPGSNFFSFDPYWAGTYFFTPQWTASVRAHYLWNDENDDPWVGYEADDFQAGEAFHANFASSYEVVPKKLRVGINGYYFKQLEESDGIDEGKEKVLAIGPGALLSFSQDTHLFFNAYFESDAEHRPEGERFVLRLVHHF